MKITITHTAAEGTLLDGTSRGDTDVHAAIKPTFRYSRNVGWYIRGSMDHPARRHDIEAVAARLRELGHDVVVDLDDTARPTAEVEADRRARATARKEALTAKAGRLHQDADERFKKADDMVGWEFGQPIITGRGSRTAADVNRRRKVHEAQDRAVGVYREAKEVERRAEVAGQRQAHRETAPATMRRIEKLEAERRGYVRDMTPCKGSGRRHNTMVEGTVTCPGCYRDVALVDSRVVEHGAHDRTDKLAEVDDQLTHWRTHLATLQDQGVKVWGPADFKKGDLVRSWGGWRTVVRVNKKSLSVESGYSWTDKVTYDDVRGCRRPSDEALPAPVEQDAPSVDLAPVPAPDAPTSGEAPAGEDNDTEDDLLAWLGGEADN